MARGDVAALPARRTSRRRRAPPSGWRRRRGRRRRRRAAAASSRRRRCRPRSRPARPRSTVAVAAGLPAASLRPTMLGTSSARRTSSVGGDLAAGADGDVVDDDRQRRWRRRRRAGGPRCRPATAGCSTGTAPGSRRRRRLDASAVRCTEWAVSWCRWTRRRPGWSPPSATASHSVSFSSSVSVGDSPVVPATTRPSLPCSCSQRASAAAPSTSRRASSSKGVTIAVTTRPNRAMAGRLCHRDRSAVPRCAVRVTARPHQDALEGVEVRLAVTDGVEQALAVVVDEPGVQLVGRAPWRTG